MAGIDKQYFSGFGALFEPIKNTKDRRGKKYEIIHARVVDIILDRGHSKYSDDANIGMISYRDILSDEETTYAAKTFDKWALPHSKLFKSYPVIGEVVMIIKSASPWSYIYPNIQFDYYFPSFPLSGEMNYNPLPYIKKGPTTEQDSIVTPSPGNNFAAKPNAGIFPIEGDVIMEGRFGGSIRLSNSSTSEISNWSDNGTPTDPIIVISAHRTVSHSLRTEHPNVDDSSIWIGSNQRIPIRIAAISDNQVLLESWDSDLIVTNASKINTNIKSDTSKIINEGSDSSS